MDLLRFLLRVFCDRASSAAWLTGAPGTLMYVTDGSSRRGGAMAPLRHRPEPSRSWPLSGLNRPMLAYAILIGIISSSDDALGQTTRTNPSASSTTRTISSSPSTSPNTPCDPSNPTSPCYSVGAPRTPCYSAAEPDAPCSAATAPYPQASPSPTAARAKAGQLPRTHAFTRDQATAQIVAKGYLKVSKLRRESNGEWHGTAEKDGVMRPITLDRDGNVTAETP